MKNRVIQNLYCYMKNRVLSKIYSVIYMKNRVIQN